MVTAIPSQWKRGEAKTKYRMATRNSLTAIFEGHLVAFLLNQIIVEMEKDPQRVLIRPAELLQEIITFLGYP